MISKGNTQKKGRALHAISKSAITGTPEVWIGTTLCSTEAAQAKVDGSYRFGSPNL
jgi:hypothetical protein